MCQYAQSERERKTKTFSNQERKNSIKWQATSCHLDANDGKLL